MELPCLHIHLCRRHLRTHPKGHRHFPPYFSGSSRGGYAASCMHGYPWRGAEGRGAGRQRLSPLRPLSPARAGSPLQALLLGATLTSSWPCVAQTKFRTSRVVWLQPWRPSGEPIASSMGRGPLGGARGRRFRCTRTADMDDGTLRWGRARCSVLLRLLGCGPGAATLGSVVYVRTATW